MNLNEAIAALAKAPEGSTIRRPGGPVVRTSRGHDEMVLHRYVTDGDFGVRAFDASDDDVWLPPEEEGAARKLREDWTLQRRDRAKADIPKADAPTAPASPQARR